MDHDVRTGLLVVLAAYASYRAYTWWTRPTPLALLPGPASPSWLWGHLRVILAAEHSVLHEQWMREYGPVVAYYGIFNRRRVVTTDLRALQHILSHNEVYQKPAEAQRELTRLLGKGVLVAEGPAHRAQRRALNPAFGPGQLRALTGIFLDKANELRDVLVAGAGPMPCDVVPFLSRATLDIIGLAGFGYAFDALSSSENSPNELAQAFKTVFRVTQAGGWVNTLMFLVPALRSLPLERNVRVREARAAMDRIGQRLLDERKAALVADPNATDGARDLLSLLVRANTSADLAHRLSDADVLAQIPTFLTAGHETTSTLLSWVLSALAIRPDVQARLRAELRAHPLPTAPAGNAPLDADALSTLERLPLLDAVVRETLRIHAPVPNTVRVATRSDTIPLAASFTDVRGSERTHFDIGEGDAIFVPILMINRSTELWGDDAHEWRPERWLDDTLPSGVRDVPGVWGNIMSFLGGARACIGFRFSLLEAKILLHALVSTLDFRLGIEPAQLGKKSGVVTRPVIKGRESEGTQLPMVVTVAGEGEA